jgi:catechol 2,3-dioxygenase-like lactoylglutathione lyase family enzyme
MKLGWFEISLPVADIAASLAFYEGLGFEALDGAVEVRAVTLQRGDCRICLYQGHLDPAAVQLVFWQGDVEAIARDLVAKGLRFKSGPNKSAEGASAMLVDPDGHHLFFIAMPVFFVKDPGHARIADTAPRQPSRIDMRLGRSELGLNVRDIAASAAFYALLGFARTGEAMLENGDCRISLHRDLAAPAIIFRGGDGTGVPPRDPDGHALRFLDD